MKQLMFLFLLVICIYYIHKNYAIPKAAITIDTSIIHPASIT